MQIDWVPVFGNHDQQINDHQMSTKIFVKLKWNWGKCCDVNYDWL